ncbi:MAG: TIGR02147 family protein [Oligoflexia bacterium]|nr:TIGR02147 family protein [Oligoflexia bacterium]
MSKQSNISLFVTDDYRAYIRAWAKIQGRGELSRVAAYLKMHTTLLSQILGGSKSMTEEQASRLCSYMKFKALETDYFIKLVQIDRAGTEQLKVIFKRQLHQLRAQSNEAKSRVPESTELSTQDRAIFYSSWQYGLVRLLTSIDEFQTVETISSYLGLSTSRVRQILDFLVSRGLCKQERDGSYQRSKMNTHIEAGSELVVRHHQNWRLKSADLQEKMDSDDLAFTAPVSISEKDVPKVRALLLDVISELGKLVEESGAERVVYLGIDWIKM